MKNSKLHKFLMVAVAVLAIYGIGNAADFTLTGQYLNVGVNDSGGLIGNGVGIQFDPTGTGHFAGAPDFITPGTPLEFYSIGINNTNLGSAGYNDGNTFGVTTINTTSGSTVSTLSYGYVGLIQRTYFDQASKSIHFSVDLLNMTGVALNNVVYARGLDPDQNYPTTFSTNNSIGTIGGKAVVTAVGPYNGLTIQIQDVTGGGVASVSSGWERNPYVLLLGGNAGNGDNTINMAWNLGTLAPYSSREIDFQYNLSAVPLPPALLLFAPGLLGLIGIRKRFNA
jgi:hypothetical protein